MTQSLSISRFLAVFRSTIREYSRTPSLLGLLVFLPILFILISISVSPSMQIPVRVPLDGLWIMNFREMPSVHSIIMTSITTSFVAGLAGLFLMQYAGNADERLVSMGHRPMEVVFARIASLALVVCAVTVVSVIVMLVHFQPRRLDIFFVGVLLVATIYGFIGMLCGAVLRRLPGLYVMLFGPMMDIGVFQNPMFVHGEQALWMKLFPGHYPLKVLLDAGFTPGLDTWNYLWGTVLYVGAVGCIAIIVSIHFMSNTK